jgi:FtsP/CotA-like multicopper oxidase with cupredoxin domain
MRRHDIATNALFLGLLVSMAPAFERHASSQGTPAANTCLPGRDLLTIPEIRSENGRLRAEIAITSGKRTLWGSAGDTRCVPQDLRYFTGRNLLKPEPENPMYASGEPIPGPTLRARVGDLIEIKFLNKVDTQAFANSLDQESTSQGNTTGCDEVRSGRGAMIYPNPGAGGDRMPNCLHGSSTSNIHFHGTHTTPDTTGDNVMLFVRPALRSGSNRRAIAPNPVFVDKQFAQIWSACEKNGTPTRWEQLPQAWRAEQERLLKAYDKTAPFRGVPGNLPPDMRLWPPNQRQINESVWPQYQIGAYPYCFRLADPKSNIMGQSPGTHWYHAHKHGSTALNVANGMTGAFVIEGPYDDDLRRFYGADFRDQLLMIQQLSSTPFPLLNPNVKGPNSVPKPQLSVNGRLNPVVKMRPGEVQLWRVVNGAFRDAVEFQSFAPQGGPAWRQIAQDGVQFTFTNYNRVGTPNATFNLAPANRADLLVKAPTQPGTFMLSVVPNEGLPLDSGLTNPPFPPSTAVTLLTVTVGGTPASPAEDFIQREADFPAFPAYLADIPERDINYRREVDFGAAHNLIDGKTFDPNHYSQVMRLNASEEWKVSNEANDKAHPFHIHVNPFQITEIFQPNAENTTDATKPCYVDNLKPETWKPCTPMTGPFVWWDTFAIPTGKDYDVTTPCTSGGKTDLTLCPAAIQPYTTCSTSTSGTTCTETVPGSFKSRSRFVDFTGSYVLHCHILIHEDRGMMQLVEVVPDAPRYIHK